MTVVFDPNRPLIFIDAEAAGPARTERVGFALDTAATQTILRPQILRHLGHTIQGGGASLSTATGKASAPEVILDRLVALEQDVSDFPVLALDLPWTVLADGLLGLDFLRGRILTIDFQQGHIELS